MKRAHYENEVDKPKPAMSHRPSMKFGCELYGDAMEQAYGAAGPMGEKSDSKLLERRRFKSYEDHS